MAHRMEEWVSNGNCHSADNCWDGEHLNSKGHYSKAGHSSYQEGWDSKHLESRSWNNSGSSGSCKWGHHGKEKSENGSSSWASRDNDEDLSANATLLGSASMMGAHKKNVLRLEKQGPEGDRAQ